MGGCKHRGIHHLDPVLSGAAGLFRSCFCVLRLRQRKRRGVAREVRRRIAIYSAIPMAVAVVVFLALSPALIWILTAGNLDTWTGMVMVAAFFIVVVPYFFEGLNGELLSVLEDGGFMSWTSTLTTWLGNIGLAAFGIFVLHSAFWAFALAVIPTIVLGSAFTWRLNHLTNRPMSLPRA